MIQQTLVPTANSRTVGILEDDDFIADLVRDGLSMFGYHPVRVAGVDSALELVEKAHPVAFVLDVQVNGRNEGFNVLEALKDLDPELFVCIYSAHVARKEMRHRAERLQADLILDKSDEPHSDAGKLAYEIKLHQIGLMKSELEIIELDRARLAKSLTPLINWETRTVEPIDQREKPTKSSSEAFPMRESEDENLKLYERLMSDDAWRQLHLGTAVGIVDGIVVSHDNTVENVIDALRGKYPHKNRFVSFITDQQEVIDIPTPFEVDF